MVARILYSLLCICIVTGSFAQTSGQSKYDPHALFAPMAYPFGSTATRAATGEPNTGYWQNRADYKIQATLNDVKNEVTGTVTIIYKNNSPHTLPFLWLQLDQNFFNKNSRGASRLPIDGQSRYGDSKNPFSGGYNIKSVKVSGESGTADHIIEDTRMQIRLKKPVKPGGEVTQITIDYSFLIPTHGADRMGMLPAKEGTIYSIAQWYPRMCVFDDIEGWNTLPYLGAGEFYLEYGDFEFAITAPASHIVVAGGDLQNPSEVFTPTQLSRYNASKTSDKTVMIRTAAEVKDASSRTKATTLTWRYKLTNARDIAWASSRSFIVDAARINLPDGISSLAMSAYPQESEGKNRWSRSTEYIKGSVENYSRRWMTYPYPVAVNVASNVGGMEYPGIVFCGATAEGADLFGVTDHEFGHTWFPMIVGSNERKYGWMDEGFTTFINSLADDDFNKGEYKSPANNEQIFPYIFSPTSEGIFYTPDAMKEANIGASLYYKPGYGLTILRDIVLGPDRFDFAFREYIRRWAFRHPTPWDFFRTMENASGESLGWFWKAWFLENYRLDQAITGVSFEGNNGNIVTVMNLDQMAMPVLLTYETVSGKKGSVKYAAEVWNNTSRFLARINETEALKWVKIDERFELPDLNRQNNTWSK